MKSIPQIAIIGAGQLGSRHLQGLSKIEQKVDITVIEPNPDAISIAKERYNEMTNNPLISKISYNQSINDLKADINVAIIATTADIRREMIERLLNKVNVKYLILEKVVFQSIQDFEFVIQLLEKNNVKAWVNCPRRMVPFFRDLREKTIHKEKIKFSVKGSNWGLASNTIHMLDLFAFLTGHNENSIDGSGLDNMVYESKREGFIELGGRLVAQTGRGDVLALSDDRDQGIPLHMGMEFNGQKIEVDQPQGLCRIYIQNSGQQPEVKPFNVPLQSELTSKQTEQILETGTSDLTSLKESFLLHKPMLDAFNTHLSAVYGKPFTVCPIT